MQAWVYEIGDVLLVKQKDAEVLARVAGYVDSLDNTTPLFVNVRVSGGLRWGERQVKIKPSQVIKSLPDWYVQQHEQWEASIKATADTAYAKMTSAQRERLEAETERRLHRSPVDVLIDRAVGRD